MPKFDYVVYWSAGARFWEIRHAAGGATMFSDRYFRHPPISANQPRNGSGKEMKEKKNGGGGAVTEDFRILEMW